MFKKGIVIFSLLFLMIVTISCVSASDINETIVANEYQNDEQISVDNQEINLVNEEKVNDKVILEENNDLDKMYSGDCILSSNDKDILSRSELDVALYPDSMSFGESKTINIFIMPANGQYDFDLKISDMSTKSVILSQNFKGRATSNFDEYYTIPIGALDVGSYTMGAYRKSDGYLMCSAYLEVKGIKSPVSVQDTTIYYGSGGYVNIEVKPSSNNCKYDFHILITDLSGNKIKESGRMYSFNPTSSVIYTIEPASLSPGDYMIHVVGTGYGSIDYCYLKVLGKKATPNLIVAKKTFKKSVKTKKYTVTLKNNINVVMKNTKITLKVNKKTFTAKTNGNGKATFKINNLKKKGKFTAVVTYKGNQYYNKVSKKVKLVLK